MFLWHTPNFSTLPMRRKHNASGAAVSIKNDKNVTRNLSLKLLLPKRLHSRNWTSRFTLESCSGKLTARNSISRMTKWRHMDTTTAPISHRFHHGRITTNDWFSDILQFHRIRQFSTSRTSHSCSFETRDDGAKTCHAGQQIRVAGCPN